MPKLCGAIGSALELEQSVVGADERQRAELAEDARARSAVVALAYLLLRQIGIDYSRTASAEPRIYHVEQHGRGELVRQLGTEIVDYQHIAVKIPLGFASAVPVVTHEALTLECTEKIDSRLVDDIVSASD